MKNYKSYLLVLITAITFVSCGKNNVEENTLKNQINEEREMTKRDSVSPKKADSTAAMSQEIQYETRGTILTERKFTKKRDQSSISEIDSVDKSAADKEVKTITNPSSSTSTTTTTSKKGTTPSNFTIQKILNGCEVGKTLTQEELSKNLAIPKDAIKLVKSITKIAENEIEIKWNSTWLVEKISDAKFNDGRLKVRFADNKMYTSGNAIGIKYNKKIYTDLVVYGRAAHIPSVKGFYWQIGKGK